jgi:hypothetical protein
LSIAALSWPVLASADKYEQTTHGEKNAA